MGSIVQMLGLQPLWLFLLSQWIPSLFPSLTADNFSEQNIKELENTIKTQVNW